MKVIIESVHPQDDLAGACRYCAARGLAAIFSSQLQEAHRREPRNLALRGQAQRASQNVAEAWCVTDKVRSARRERSELQPFVDPAESVCKEGPPICLVEVR
jgi:hypothetical protein